MKLSFAVLLGALIALGGVSIILNALFKIDLPIFRIALGAFFIYLGIAFLLGRGAPRHDDWRASDEPNRLVPHSASGQDLKYDVVFGRGIVDLTQLEPSDQPRRLEINVIFGDALVKVDPSVPYELEASSVFGSARMPDRSATAFGSLHYTPKDQRPTAMLRIKLAVVFGSAEVIEERSVATRPGGAELREAQAGAH